MEAKNLYKKIFHSFQRSFQLNRAFSRTDKKILEKLERYRAHTITFLGKKLEIVDSLTFLSSYDEIFNNSIYKFHSGEKNIIIVDCGANIGLATIYFKKLYPDAHIVAFEPDPNIFNSLKKNIKSFGFENVFCKNEAVSCKDELINFKMEGGHSGMITKNEGLDISRVKAIRLKSFLKNYKKITFLKIDIEGEEVNVIPDIADDLLKVDYLFLEYHSFIDGPQKLDELLKNVSNAGMRYYIKEAANKNSPFINREIFLKMDMLVNIFCYR